MGGSSGHTPRKATYAQIQKGGSQSRRGRHGSVSRASHVPANHPSLPKSGASRMAKQTSKDYDHSFMQTPESGICGYVFHINESRFIPKVYYNKYGLAVSLLFYWLKGKSFDRALTR